MLVAFFMNTAGQKFFIKNKNPNLENIFEESFMLNKIVEDFLFNNEAIKKTLAF